MKVDIDLMNKVYSNIKKNTKHKEKLFNFEMFYNSNMFNIKYKLENGLYKHGKYNIFLIKDPKCRVIMSEKLIDKIVNHYISEYYLKKTIFRKLINSNVASRINMGSREALRLVKGYINSLKLNGEVYVLKCDIKKFFYNIDHVILKNKLLKLGLEKDALSIIFDIIDSTNMNYVNKDISKLNTDKDILYKYGKGLPIGNMSSQIFALYYLNDMDHFIKEKLRIKSYVRYMDDFLLFSNDKKYLKECLIDIQKLLSDVKLELNKRTNIYRLSVGLTFLGYTFKLKNKRLIIKICNSTKRRIKKKDINDKSLVSYKGFFKYSNVNDVDKIIDFNIFKKSS